MNDDRFISVFLSYSNNDIALAERIAKDLREHAIETWFDKWKIFTGDSIPDKIQDGLKNADFIAVLLTRNSIDSEWVAKEWQGKIDQEIKTQNIKILPLLADDCEIPHLLKDKQYADFRNNYEFGLSELIKAIKQHYNIQDTSKNKEIEDRLVNINYQQGFEKLKKNPFRKRDQLTKEIKG